MPCTPEADITGAKPDKKCQTGARESLLGNGKSKICMDPHCIESRDASDDRISAHKIHKGINKKSFGCRDSVKDVMRLILI